VGTNSAQPTLKLLTSIELPIPNGPD